MPPRTASSEVIDRFAGRWHDLSAFSSARLVVDGIPVSTAEHGFHLLKTDDPDWRVKIAAAATPQKAKEIGRRAPLRPHWDVARRYDAMRQVQWLKFGGDFGRGLLLTGTGDAVLIEGNTWHDNTWGDCHCGNRDGGHPQCIPAGHNLLGWMLMRIRDELTPRYEQ